METDLSFGDGFSRKLLVSPLQWHLAAEKPDVSEKGVRVHIGDHPIGVDLKRLCAIGKKSTPKADIFAAFDLWFVTYTVGVITEGSWGLTRLGFQVRYNVPQNPDVVILEAIPDSRFVKTVGAEITCSADINVSGEGKLSDVLQGAVGLSVPQVANVSFSLGGSLFVRLGFAVLTPLITTIGVGSRAGEWVLKRDQKELVGTNVFQHVLLVPRHVQRLQVMTKVYATIRGFFSLPIRLEGPETPLLCELITDKP